MHRIFMIDSSFKFALNTLHMRNTKFGKYRNTYRILLYLNKNVLALRCFYVKFHTDYCF